MDALRVVILFTALLLLAGCAPAPDLEATPIPTPAVWQVQYSSELAWMAPYFSQCLPPEAGIGLAVEEKQEMVVAGSRADLMLHWGEIDPGGPPAFQLGEDSLVIIIHSENPITDLTLEALQQMYRGEAVQWSELSGAINGSIHTWVYPAHLSLQMEFADRVDLAGALISHRMAPDIPAMLQAVSNDPLAIGFIPAAWMDPSVRRLEIEGFTAAHIPVVLLASENLDPNQREWVACIQQFFTLK